MDPILALYVYSPSTFTSDRVIESEQGKKYGPGPVSLDIGIYRIEVDAKVVPTHSAAANGHSPHDLVIVNGTKTGGPVPARAASTFGISRIKAFLNGEGDEAQFG